MSICFDRVVLLLNIFSALAMQSWHVICCGDISPRQYYLAECLPFTSYKSIFNTQKQQTKLLAAVLVWSGLPSGASVCYLGDLFIDL